jgi:DNA gyrase/topoisomerase IV subunit A
VLPARSPNLFINGATGIAVGMATTSRRTTSARSAPRPIKLLDNPDEQCAVVLRKA